MMPRPPSKKPVTEGLVLIESDDRDSASPRPDQCDANPVTLESIRLVFRGEIEILRAEIKSDIAPLQSALSSYCERVDEVEAAVTNIDTRLNAMETNYANLLAMNEKMQAKIDDLENRSRRDNLRVVGIPEGVEKGNPTEFMSNFFFEVLGPLGLESPPSLERAHRAAGAKPGADERPRAMILKVHRFQVKERILRLARQQDKLIFHGSRVHIFPDFSVDIMKRRASYNTVKNQLRAAGVRYGLLYPARLRVSFNGTDQVFLTPQAAENFFSNVIQPRLNK